MHMIQRYLYSFFIFCFLFTQFSFAQSISVSIKLMGEMQVTRKLREDVNFRNRDVVSHNIIEDNIHIFEFPTWESSSFRDNQMAIFIPDHRLAVTKTDNTVRVATYDQMFKGGNYINSGITKIIHGKKATKYTLTPSLFKLDFWVTDAPQQENKLIESFRNAGLLKNIPATKNVIAVNYQGIELDITSLHIRDRSKRWLRNDYERFVETSGSYYDTLEACYKKNKAKKIPLDDISDVPKKLKLKYKTVYASDFLAFFGSEDTRSQKKETVSYWESSNKYYIGTNTDPNKVASHYLLLDNQQLSIDGDLVDNKFYAEKFFKTSQNRCRFYTQPILIKKERVEGKELSYYMAYQEKEELYIAILTLDENSGIDNRFLYKSFELPKGEIKKMEIISNTYRYNVELTTTKESKNIRLHVEK